MLTPNTDAFGHHRYHENWLHLDPPRHLFLFNNASIHRLVMQAGFTERKSFSTIRDANWTLAGSRALHGVGHYHMGNLPFIARLIGMWLLYTEWIHMRFNPFCGEEIVLIARK